MAQNLTAAQQTQLENRDATGQFKFKTHADVDDTADVLGVGEPQGEPMPVDGYPADEQRAVELAESVEAIHDIDPAHDIDGRDYEDALDRVQGLAAEAISAGQDSDVQSSYELAQSRSDDFRAMDMEDHAECEDDIAERIKIELDDATAKG